VKVCYIHAHLHLQSPATHTKPCRRSFTSPLPLPRQARLSTLLQQILHRPQLHRRNGV
jgi:hypothetical protein